MKLLFYDTSCARVVQVGSVRISSTTATKRPLFQLIYNCRVKEEQQTAGCLMKGTQVLVPPRSTTTLYCQSYFE